MKKNTFVIFIGRQLSRLKLGQTYYSIVISTVSAISLVSMAFGMTIYLLIFLFPVILFGSFLIGYMLDKLNISALDYRKTAEISGRFLNTLDEKNYDMRMIQTEIIVRAIRDEKFDVSKFSEEKRREFHDKWSPEGERTRRLK